jgi:hypothetical protein
MSTIPKQPQPGTPAQPVRPVAATPPPPVRRPMKAQQVKKEYTFLFDKENYIWMAAGMALIFIGFMLMSGGRSADPTKFNYDEIYSFRRITLAPIVILLGFVMEMYAIMKKPKETITI